MIEFSLTQKISLSLEYPVIFHRNSFSSENPVLADTISRKNKDAVSVVFVVDKNVFAAWPSLILSIHMYCQTYARQLRLVAEPLVIVGGESAKNSSTNVAMLHKWLFQNELDRHSVVVAIGGGALLDMVGYVAATFHRGIRLVRMPTTVLAQNDAGIGVKTSINQFQTKNLIGCFAAPFAVINDFEFLKTLPERDQRAGIAEAIKVSLIKDPDFFFWISLHAKALAEFDSGTIHKLIQRCAELHLDHIRSSGDPFEMGNSRPLDFGHWAAHKLESMTHNDLRHGEAVAIGMALDCSYSYLQGWLPEGDFQLIMKLMRELGFNIWVPLLNHPTHRQQLLEGIEDFREHLGGELNLTMLTGIGRCVEINEVDPVIMDKAIDEVWRYSKSGNVYYEIA